MPCFTCVQSRVEQVFFESSWHSNNQEYRIQSCKVNETMTNKTIAYFYFGEISKYYFLVYKSIPETFLF